MTQPCTDQIRTTYALRGGALQGLHLFLIRPSLRNQFLHAESNATAINIKNFASYNLHIKLLKKTHHSLKVC